MNWSIGDMVTIKMGAEDSQNQIIRAADGNRGKVSLIYTNPYEPDINRYEVELLQPITIDDQSVRTMDGLYDDNLSKENLSESKRPWQFLLDARSKKKNEPKRIDETAVIRFDQWELMHSLEKTRAK
jgi:hypothetical protein